LPAAIAICSALLGAVVVSGCVPAEANRYHRHCTTLLDPVAVPASPVTTVSRSRPAAIAADTAGEPRRSVIRRN
jgi:hypothetical protein